MNLSVFSAISHQKTSPNVLGFAEIGMKRPKLVHCGKDIACSDGTFATWEN